MLVLANTDNREIYYGSLIRVEALEGWVISGFLVNIQLIVCLLVLGYTL